MKRIWPILPALLVLTIGTALYWRGACSENDLARELTLVPTELSGAKNTRMAVPTGIDAGRSETAAQPIPWTPEETQKFLTHWTAESLKEEQRLRESGADVFAKLAPYKAHLAGLRTEDFHAICLTVPEGAPPITSLMNERSSETEIRGLLILEAFGNLVKRDPFLALELPRHTPEWTLAACARIDAERTWRIVKERYGGSEAPIAILREVLNAAGGEDVVERMALAGKWGVLGRVVELWPGEAAESPAGRDAWLEAIRETSPPDKETHLARFAKEVEAVEGIAGVQRIIDRLAAPGTPLYDRIIREAAGRDLEESAGPRADWILSRVSPAAAAGTAETLMKHWTETDPLSASEWLKAVPKSAPWRNAAILTFVREIEPHDPEAAAEWRLAADGN